MREHRYRAWDSYQKKMYSWDEIGEMNSHGYLSLWNALIGMTEHITMMDSTGLKDKNGIEIYESDYVATHDGVYLIEYDCNELRYYLVRDEGGMTKKYPWYSGKYELKVIGNIYENPELLKGAV